MASCTPERSAILSLMVEEVSGTEEIITTRQGLLQDNGLYDVLSSEYRLVLHRQQGRRAKPPGQRP